MSEQTYTIAPLVWRRFRLPKNAIQMGSVWDCETSLGTYLVLDSVKRNGKPPGWRIEASDVQECPTVAACKAAAEAYHRERVASLLVEVSR